jgi:plastocyanin
MKRPLIAALLALAAGLALAGNVRVTVTDKDGKPAADVVVLIEAAVKQPVVPAAAPVVIAQEGLRFQPFLSVVPAGSTLRFVNRDSYDHHVRSTPSGPLGSMPAAASFELRLDAAADSSPSPNDEYQSRTTRRRANPVTQQDVKVTQPGPIGLGCHIHGSMRGQVYVAATPWFAKTDANGQASIENVPEGALEVTLWHADQLQDQPPQRAQLGAAPLQVVGQLNFVPRQRRR